MTAIAKALLQAAWTAIGGDVDAVDRVAFTAEGGLPSVFRSWISPVRPLPQPHSRSPDSSSSAMAARPIPSMLIVGWLPFWFSMSIRPIGWSLPAPWDPIAGDYATRDGWIRLHTNAPHHRAAAERVLGVHGDKAGMAAAVAGWQKRDLEEASSKPADVRPKCAAPPNGRTTLRAWRLRPSRSSIGWPPSRPACRTSLVRRAPAAGPESPRSDAGSGRAGGEPLPRRRWRRRAAHRPARLG